MALLYAVLGICLIYAGIAIPSARSKERKLEQMRREQDAQKAALKRQQEEAKEFAKKQKEMEKEQARQAKEQARLAKEQERQAKELEKHEREIEKLNHEVSKAQYDIDFLHERIANLSAMQDNYKAKQEGLDPASDEWANYQSKILVLDNQIHSANVRMGKAKFVKRTAESKLSA